MVSDAVFQQLTSLIAIAIAGVVTIMIYRKNSFIGSLFLLGLSLTTLLVDTGIDYAYGVIMVMGSIALIFLQFKGIQTRTLGNQDSWGGSYRLRKRRK